MNARCARCKNVFRTEQYGSQTCPHCGAEVILRDPNERPPEPPSHAGPEGAPREPSGAAPEGWPGAPGPEETALPHGAPASERTPWEERESRGLVDAYFSTLKLSLTDPVRFFARMPASDAKGAISYYWLTAGIAFLFSGLWQAAATFAGFGGIDPRSLQLPPELAEMVGKYGPAQLAAMSLSSGIGTALLAPIALFIGAGVVHLGALVFGSAHRGFDATLRATAYAAAPLLLQAIPLCGQFIGIIGFFWYVTLVVIGMSKLHGAVTWRAAAAVLAPGLLFFCCSCCAFGSGMAMIMGAAGGAQFAP